MNNSLDYEINKDYRCGYNAGFSDGRAVAWIPVSEATPDVAQKVIIFIAYTGGGLVDTATFRGGFFVGAHWHCEQEQITHWMPLPGEPEEDAGAHDRKCVICGKPIAGFGNNPWPVKEEGECCDECNQEHVIPARIDFIRTKEGGGDA